MMAVKFWKYKDVCELFDFENENVNNKCSYVFYF